MAGVTAAALEESKGTELEEPKIVTITTPASLTLRWESEKGLKVVYNVTGNRRLEPIRAHFSFSVLMSYLDTGVEREGEQKSYEED